MSGNIDNLAIDFEFLIDSTVVSNARVLIDKEKEVEFKVNIENAFERCVAGNHFNNLTLRFTTEFDDEAKINEAGFRFVSDVAQALIKNIATYFDDFLIDNYWANCLELACSITSENLRQTADDYDYTEWDVKGFFGHPRQLENHQFAMFRGKERAVPQCREKRIELLNKYADESKKPDFDAELFWNDYTWSQLKEEKKEMLKEISVTTQTIPSSLVYRSLDRADYKCHKKPSSGKIHRQMNINISRCRICYSAQGDNFTPESDCVLPKSASFVVIFRPLCEFLIKK